jgi:hypothetical protein
MKITGLFIAAALLFAGAGVAHAQKLVRAEFYSKTGGDNKDHDTGVYVSVLTSDGNTVLAEIKNADTSGQDQTEYNDYSDHTIALVIKSNGSSKADCAKFKYKVGSQANGKDKWEIERTSVTLFFDDGTSLQQTSGGFTLESKDSQYTESGTFGGA